MFLVGAGSKLSHKPSPLTPSSILQKSAGDHPFCKATRRANLGCNDCNFPCRNNPRPRRQPNPLGVEFVCRPPMGVPLVGYDRHIPSGGGTLGRVRPTHSNPQKKRLGIHHTDNPAEPNNHARGMSLPTMPRVDVRLSSPLPFPKT